MKAIVYANYGSPNVLKYEEIEKPTPADDEVLIKVRAAALNPLDYHLLKSPFMRRVLFARSKQKFARPGRDVAGEVEAVGRNVTQFKPGDAVFGSCSGACAEYVCARESTLVMKPDSVTFEQAAAVPVAGLTALQALRDKGRIHTGQKVLINGAAGGVGTFAVQFAKSFGANVTGVCSTRNVEMVRSIGADRVIDYTREDFTKGAQRFDLILDNVGNHPLSAFRRVLNPKGTYIMIGAMTGGSMIGAVLRSIKSLLLSPFISHRVPMMLGKVSKDDLNIIGGLMEDGKVTPVIDRRYGLSDVAEAIRYLDTRHARGKVIITLEHDNKA